MTIKFIMPTVDVGEARSVADLLRIGTTLFWGAGANLWFRGQGDCNWPLWPKIHRKYDSISEAQMCGEFMSHAHARFASCPARGDLASWRVLMQHHGLPTRLLDWSSSILVAAFFAVENEALESTAGAIWATSPGVLNGAMTRATGEDSYLYHLSDVHLGDDQPKARAVAPPYTEARMMVQQAGFTVHNDRTPLEAIPEASSALHRIIIPSEWKGSIAVELSALCGIHEAAMFPDLEHLSLHLGRTSGPFEAHSKAAETNPKIVNRPPIARIPVGNRIVLARRSRNAKLPSLPLSAVLAGPCVKGDRVEIVADDCDFKGFEGIVDDVTAGLVVVKLTLFGRFGEIELKSDGVRKVWLPSPVR